MVPRGIVGLPDGLSNEDERSGRRSVRMRQRLWRRGRKEKKADAKGAGSRRNEKGGTGASAGMRKGQVWRDMTPARTDRPRVQTALLPWSAFRQDATLGIPGMSVS